MSLTESQPNPENLWIAIDLETTGLSYSDDKIIEIGAVKFLGDEVLDTFHSFVNPNRRLSGFIKSYTGITQAQVNSAEPFSKLYKNLEKFLNRTPLIGHNIEFDLNFLKTHGMTLTNETADTWDMAYVAFPNLREYSLQSLSKLFNITHQRPHRAVDDASATMEVFLTLQKQWEAFDILTIGQIQQLSSRSTWVLSYFLKQIYKRSKLKTVSKPRLDLGPPIRRFHVNRILKPREYILCPDEEQVADLLKSDSALSRVIPGFEQRDEQIQMARAVARTINDGNRLIVEAGTGIGKTIAYLLPSVLYASMNDRRVVISTNTINLQEQLLERDLPSLTTALGNVDQLNVEDVKYCQLKGRSNYLCINRWKHVLENETLTIAEARMASKILVWLKTTKTGDRSELNLGHPSVSNVWERFSAQGALTCPQVKTPCFLRLARERSNASHIVIVNHALLLSDLINGGGLIPEHDVLIVDEAHHLEDEATRQFGFNISQTRFTEYLNNFVGDQNIFKNVLDSFQSSKIELNHQQAIEEISENNQNEVSVALETAALTFGLIAGLMGDNPRQHSSDSNELRISNTKRVQPDWSDVEISWQKLDDCLIKCDNLLIAIITELDAVQSVDFPKEEILSKVISLQEENIDLRDRLREFIVQPNSNSVYWVTQRGYRAELVLHAAPLDVGDVLDRKLYSRSDSVVMTGATLRANGTFQHIKTRTGFVDSEEISLGSPFDYPNSALLCVPDDMPEPSSWAYQTAIEQAITDSVIASDGRTMALFTSHASLQMTSKAIRSDLKARGITVLAQGVDGSPANLVKRFMEDPSSVLLGTASFWEGIDLPGDSLKVVVMVRLPFSVPSDPLFEARSELLDNPFTEYALPQAILRLRQGFGRLIRSNNDRGVALILDRRLTSRGYGRQFIESLPDVEIRRDSLHDLERLIHEWLRKR